MTLYIESIWFRKITADAFLTMETEGLFDNGGGSGWIDIPKGAKRELFEFLGRAADVDSGIPLEIDAHRIGDPSQHGKIEFEPRTDGRYRIPNQGRKRPGSSRHAAWNPDVDTDFPSAEDLNNIEEARAFLDDIGQLRLYILKASDANFYAGYTVGNSLPESWPGCLSELFGSKSSGLLIFNTGPGAGIVEPIVAQVLRAVKRRHNVLLYGPPGTGKTRAMAQLRQIFSTSTGSDVPALEFDPYNQEQPFSEALAAGPLPGPITVDWVTFHQTYSYEDFILGLRPDNTQPALKLRPRMGRLLDLAVQADPEIGRGGSAVMFIDELNRGNVSRIFGEFITFMDDDYRGSNRFGQENPDRLPVPFPQLNSDRIAGKTEPIDRPAGGATSLPTPWYWPNHVYVIASMNSVDRAVAPLDTALSRRFERIEIGPDLVLLAAGLKIDTENVLAEVRTYVTNSDASNLPALSAAQTAWLLLKRLNDYICTSLGPDFQIGHSYFLGVKDWNDLAAQWDYYIWPQVQERYSSRPQYLEDLLKVGTPIPGYLISNRTLLPGETDVDHQVLEMPDLSRRTAADPDSVSKTLIFLALPACQPG